MRAWKSIAQPNIIADPSHIAVLSANKIPAQDIYTPITSKENQSRKTMLEML